ncbi:hypothetical protein [Nitrosophilus kaiyonis]|uniref:hypothetical protein n=1 Tax=Nitrosophilus kaiyonis TaxID=2930200 RepID=UPI0024906640|nr:hypothetical protein [Nitrosophilus kaiyonis]
MYLFIVTLILSILGVVAYYLYIKQKGEKLSKIEKGICPECEKESITVKRSKSGGCSGTTNVIYRCENCGYEEEFNVGASGCGSGKCGI